jgi:hypothetical protein
MSEIGINPIAAVPFGGGAVIRNPPTVTVLQPVAVVSAQTPTIQWQYLSPIPRAQAAYRIRLLSQDGSNVLFDTFETPVSPAPPGFTALTVDTFQVVLPFILSNGNIYQVEVSASDGLDFSLPVTVTFAAALETVGDLPDVTSVGSVYEIGINGQGFMLADRPERPVRRRSILLEPPRLATTDTPFTEAVERYTMIGYSNFVSGAGQRRLDRSRSIDDRYWQSEGVDPFEDGELRLLPDTEREVATTYSNPLTVVADEELYVLTGAKQFTNVDEPGDTPVVFTVDDATTIKSVTSDGLFWYATDGTNIFRNDEPVDPGSTPWSTIAADLIVWCSDRIVAIEDDSGTAVFNTLAPDGTEEVASGRFKFEDATINAVTSGDGYVWFSVDRAGVSEVRAWQLGGDPSSVSFTAFTLPAGERVTGLGFYLGNVFIRASSSEVAGDEQAYLYRAVPNDGVLTAQRLTGLVDAGLDDGAGVWGGTDRFAFFSWQKMTADDRSGIGAIDLSTGGWAKWVAASGAAADGRVGSIVSWRGRPTFTVVGDGVYTTVSDPVPSGWLRTSHTDLGSSLSKIVDDIRLVFEPLPGSSSVTVLLSLDGGNSYVQQGDAVSFAGAKEVTYRVGRATATVGLEIRLTADGLTPVVSVAQVRVHPLSLRDELVVLPINCADTLSGLNGQVLPESGPGRGMQRIRFLENLISTRVKFQDVDWPHTKQSSIWEVVDIDTSGPGIYETRQNRRTESAVATVTLRRPS